MNQKKKIEFTGNPELLSNLQVNVNVLYDKGNKLKTLFYKNQEMSQKNEKRVSYIFYFNYNDELFNIISFDDMEYALGFEEARIPFEIKQEGENILVEKKNPIDENKVYSVTQLLPYEEMRALHPNMLDRLLHINNFQEKIFE